MKGSSEHCAGVKSTTIYHTLLLQCYILAMLVQHTEELAVLLGHDVCNIIGQGDKAHIPIGLTAATKQAPLLMSIRYKVRLPDHDFVIATEHKLTPTVVGLRVIKPQPIGDRTALRYFGPTRIQIKFLKHTPSNAAVQIKFLEEMLDKYVEFTKSTDGKVKPVLIITRDGHNGPRFPTTRNTLAVIFKERVKPMTIILKNYNLK